MHYNITDYIRNKYFEELSELPPYIRQAVLFRHITREMPLQIKDTDYIAGWYGFEDIVVAPKREFPHICVLNDEQEQIRETLCNKLKINTSFTMAHTCIDYGSIVQRGLEYYIARVEQALLEYPDDNCLIAMKMSLEAACKFAERFAMVAKEKTLQAETPEQKARFEKIWTALCRVPRRGARNFLEAVQSVWIMHSLVPMAETGWYSISIGRIDQYLYPFYREFIDNGGSEQEVKNILKNLFVLLDSYGDAACAMNIGGMDENGDDMMNSLSRILVEIEKEMSLRAPIFAVRVTPNMPEDILDSVIDFDLFKIGQPTFYSEDNCRRAVINRGISEEKAVNFSANSCMGLMLPGWEFADMWGIMFNSHLPLELAINHGKPLNSDMDFALSVVPADITDFKQLVEQYGRYLTELAPVCAEIQELAALEAEVNRPDPLLSALTEGCIQNRRDRSVGAMYNTVTVETMGLVNTCDALEAIRELVFEQKKYTLEELIAAARVNYEGYEDLRRDLSKCKKYGTNDETVNAIFKQITQMVSDAWKKTCRGNRLYLPSLHTLDDNVSYGAKLYATLDGRKDGRPVSKNANPSGLLQKVEPTSHILSAVAFDQTAFSGGQPIDLYFDKAWFETKESRDKIKALIRTYFQLGGLQIQVNSMDIALLEKAHMAPEEYPFVIVRRGGCSVRFTEMRKENREEFIKLAKRMEQKA